MAIELGTDSKDNIGKQAVIAGWFLLCVALASLTAASITEVYNVKETVEQIETN